MAPTRLAISTLLLAILAAPALVPAAQAADIQHEVRALNASFDRLRIDGSVDVKLVQGPTASVTVDAPAGLAADIHTAVDDATLVVDSGHMHMIDLGWTGHSHLLVTVTTPMLHEITINGSSDLSAQSYSSNEPLFLHLRSSGDLKIEQLAVKKLDTEIQGSADVHLGGSATEQSVKIQGSGDYHAENLKSSSASVAIQGSGDASVWAQDALAVQIAGSGDVEYWGSPTVSRSIAGSGEVTSRGAKK